MCHPDPNLELPQLQAHSNIGFSERPPRERDGRDEYNVFQGRGK
jgi:hypothetical protein